jgi:hypothetical protein
MLSSVVVDDFHIRGAFRAPRPLEAETPLLIDPDAELSGAIAFQGFEPVALQEAQIVQTHCRVENLKAPISLVGEALKISNE